MDTYEQKDLVLVRLDTARTALAEAKTIQETKKILDVAAAAEILARRQQMGEEAINYAISIKIEALAQLGRMLKEMLKNPGTKGQLVGRGVIGGTKDEPPIPTLSDLGLDKKTSKLAQDIASLPEEELEKVKGGIETLTQVNRKRKEKKRESRRKTNREVIANTRSPEELLGNAKFATIMLDPPWDWGDEGDIDQLGRAKPTYETMSLEKLMELPVDKFADDDCHIYLWITNRSLPKGFQLLEKWGFRYITAITWAKPSFGMGNYFRGQTEHVLFGVKGSQPLKRKDASTLFSAPRGPKGHSSKPVEFYDFVESCSPGPYLEMFARGNRKDWTSWGAEA